MITMIADDATATQALMFMFAPDDGELDEQERAASPAADERVDWGAWWAAYAETME